MFGSFPPSPLVVCASKVYSGIGADIVYGIITLKIPLCGSKRVIAQHVLQRSGFKACSILSVYSNPMTFIRRMPRRS
jgi:hypothetical protein